MKDGLLGTLKVVAVLVLLFAGNSRANEESNGDSFSSDGGVGINRKC